LPLVLVGLSEKSQKVREWYEDEIQYLTKYGRHYKPDNLAHNNEITVKEERVCLEREDDQLLRQMNKVQANISIWDSLMSMHNTPSSCARSFV